MEKMVLALLPIFVSAIAILVSYFTYKRQKTFENENHVYNYQLGKYHELLDRLCNLFVTINDKIDDLYWAIDENPRNTEDIEQIKDEIDREFSKAEMEIFAISPFLPEVVYKAIEKFMDSFFEVNFDEVTTTRSMDKEIKKLDEAENLVFDIAEVMRDELGIDRLNINIRKRIHNTRRKTENSEK